jgi:hypothetical protein
MAPNDDQLALIKEEEDRLGLSLVAVRERDACRRTVMPPSRGGTVRATFRRW